MESKYESELAKLRTQLEMKDAEIDLLKCQHTSVCTNDIVEVLFSWSLIIQYVDQAEQQVRLLKEHYYAALLLAVKLNASLYDEEVSTDFNANALFNRLAEDPEMEVSRWPLLVSRDLSPLPSKPAL